jgi:hypothetical protein
MSAGMEFEVVKPPLEEIKKQYEGREISEFQLYHGENKLIFNEMMMKSALY